jgi:hypothetical protein
LAGKSEIQNSKFEIPPVCLTNIDKPQAMQIAEQVLTAMHFAIEKADLNSGLIRTRPLAGAQFFELWRSDNVGPSNAALANIHSVQRVAELHIQQQADRLIIRCDVQIQKLSLPESASADRPAPGAPVKRIGLSPKQEKGSTWIDLGKDTLLSTEILRRISSKL